MIYPEEERLDIIIKIKNDNVNIDIKGLRRNDAKCFCENIILSFPDNKFIQEKMPEIIKSLGFCGVSFNGDVISVRGRMPNFELEKQTCPRRINELGPWEKKENVDYWRMIGSDKVCSFCGSLHPDRVIELIKKNGIQIVERSTKSYKWYIHQENVPNAMYGGIKYYRFHDTDEFIKQYNEIIDSIKN